MKRFFAGALVATALSATAAFAQQPDTLGRIKAAQVINVAFASDAPPFSFAGPDRAPAGYSIDLCKRVIARIGQAVGNPGLKVNWVAGSVAERLQMVQSGKADLDCANTTQTLARLANVDFSSLIFVDAGSVILRADSPANSIAELAGRKIAVLKDTTTEKRLNAIVRADLPGTQVIPVTDVKQGLVMLESGAVEAYAGDRIKLVALAVENKPGKFVLLTEELSLEPYAIALPRGDAALRLEVNRALTQVYQSGEIETIFATWLGKLGRPTGLLAAMFLLNTIPE